MLASLRKSLGTWPVRFFFLLLTGVFVLWGIGDVFRNMSDEGAPASVAGKRIELPDVQAAYQRQMQQLTRMLGNTQPTPEMRRAMAEQAVSQLLTQAALVATAEKLGLAVPDEALRQAVYDIPGFKNAAGQFDRNQMTTVLANNNLNEARFLTLLRSDMMISQLTEAARAGVAAPAQLAGIVYQAQRETRTATIVSFPFASVPAPADPGAAVLQRWWQNHPDLYSSPEYRHIKAVVLSADTIARGITVPDSDVMASYEQHKAEFAKPETRDVQVVMLSDAAKAADLALAWRGGADWDAIQKQASADGGSAIQLDDTTAAEIPLPDLGAAVFSAGTDTVSGPVPAASQQAVFRVTKIAGGQTADFAAVKDQLRQRLAHDKGADQLYERANKVEDVLAGGANLDELPDDLGLSAVSGTLDAQGNTLDGQKAPIPGSDQLRAAVVAAAFQQAKGDAPHLTEGPDDSYYAVAVQDITPPQEKPYDEVADKVLADWRHDAQRHAQDEASTKLLLAVRGGQTLQLAASAVGLTATTTPPVAHEGAPPAGVPASLVQPLFGMKQGDATVVETPDGFVVAQLSSVTEPDPAADPAGFATLRDQLAQSMGNDVETTLATALRNRGNPRVDQAQIDSIAQP